jgi:hypothetical protein
VNSWARRHQAALTAPLDPGETLTVACRVALARRSPPTGFPAPGKVFVLGITDRRVVLWRTTPVLARPAGLATSVPFTNLASVAVVRRLGRSRLRVALGSGPVALLEPMWGGSLTAIAAVAAALGASHGNGT